MKRINELDGLRAIAILAVLGCHYAAFSSSLRWFAEFGWVGVDIFFALSGYLITKILLGMRGKSAPYKTFYFRRAVRIIPPYLMVTVCLLVLGVASQHNFWLVHKKTLVRQVFFLQAYEPGTLHLVIDVARHVRWHLTHLPALLPIGHLQPLRFGLSPTVLDCIGIYWSLSIEEYFYILWAPIVLRFSRRGIILCGLSICLVSILLRWIDSDYRAYFDLLLRFDALLYGAFLALLLERWKDTKAPARVKSGLAVTFGAALAVIAFCLWQLRPLLGRELRDAPLGLAVALPALGIAAACLVGVVVLRARSNWWFARLLRSAPMQYVGTISYTMYLVHMIVALIVVKLATQIHVPCTWVLGMVSVVLTIMWARASWHYLEKPLLDWKDRSTPSSVHPGPPALN